jgi:hypothetical protein
MEICDVVSTVSNDVKFNPKKHFDCFKEDIKQNLRPYFVGGLICYVMFASAFYAIAETCLRQGKTPSEIEEIITDQPLITRPVHIAFSPVRKLAYYIHQKTS